MKTQTIPIELKIPVETEGNAMDIAIEIILGGIDMLSDTKLKNKIKCEFGDQLWQKEF